MDKVFLEFLNELAYCLEHYEKIWWADWMKKSIKLFEEKQDLDHFLRAFGGMGSFNDCYFELPGVTDILKTITYSIACTLHDNGDSDIFDIMRKEQQRYINIFNDKVAAEYLSNVYDLQNEYDYLNYLIDNYHLSNLHETNEKYISELLGQKRIK